MHFISRYPEKRRLTAFKEKNIQLTFNSFQSCHTDGQYSVIIILEIFPSPPHIWREHLKHLSSTKHLNIQVICYVFKATISKYVLTLDSLLKILLTKLSWNCLILHIPVSKNKVRVTVYIFSFYVSLVL